CYPSLSCIHDDPQIVNDVSVVCAVEILHLQTPVGTNQKQRRRMVDEIRQRRIGKLLPLGDDSELRHHVCQFLTFTAHPYKILMKGAGVERKVLQRVAFGITAYEPNCAAVCRFSKFLIDAFQRGKGGRAKTRAGSITEVQYNDLAPMLA